MRFLYSRKKKKNWFERSHWLTSYTSSFFFFFFLWLWTYLRSSSSLQTMDVSTMFFKVDDVASAWLKTFSSILSVMTSESPFTRETVNEATHVYSPPFPRRTLTYNAPLHDYMESQIFLVLYSYAPGEFQYHYSLMLDTCSTTWFIIMIHNGFVRSYTKIPIS